MLIYQSLLCGCLIGWVLFEGCCAKRTADSNLSECLGGVTMRDCGFSDRKSDSECTDFDEEKYTKSPKDSFAILKKKIPGALEILT